MSHENVAPDSHDPVAYKTRVGLVMFLCYLAFYVACVAINVGAPLLMEREVCLGMNFATVYGFALIVGALLLALVYDLLCRARERATNNGTTAEKGE